jgi:DNA-binding LacI/PurR family transcriptional regulator
MKDGESQGSAAIRRPVTSHDVARLAGVSQSAVSRAFTPGASVSQTMRDRITTAAATLGYHPNFLPRMMLSGRSGIVAVVVGGFYNPFHAATLESFSRALRAAGKTVMLVQVESDRSLDEIVGELAGYRVDAVVSALSVLSQSAADALSASRIPVILLNAGITSPWIRTVDSDNEGAGRTAARRLHSRGAKRFAYVGAESSASAAREKGFGDELRRLGVADIVSHIGNLDHDGGYAAGCALLVEKDRPDGIFCVNDLTAIGIIDALRVEAGLSVPSDAMIIGYDNIAAASWPAYALTTFDQQVDDMVDKAVGLLELAPDDHPLRAVVPFRFVERHSA